jgi:Holliday junction resolvase
MSGARAERQRLVKKLQKQGFSVTRTGSGHWKVESPVSDGHVIMAFSPRSPADYATVKHLKRIGYKE